MQTLIKIVVGYHLTGVVSIQSASLKVNLSLKPFSPFRLVTCLCRYKCQYQHKLVLGVKDGTIHAFG